MQNARPWRRAVWIATVALFWLVLVTLGHRLQHLLAPEGLGYVAAAAVVVAAAAYLALATLLAIRLVSFLPRPGRRGVALIVAWMTLLALGHGLSHTGADGVVRFLEDIQTMFGAPGFALFVALYGLLLALPFFPGVEVGFAVMAMFGAQGALGSYLATVLGLGLAFAAGRLVPARLTERLHARLEGRPGEETASAAGGDKAAARLNAVLPGALGAFLVRNRYLALALALNVPANAAIGGGGGVALLAGMSPLFAPVWFVLTVAVATSPVPLLFALGVVDVELLLGFSGSIHGALAWLESLFGLR